MQIDLELYRRDVRVSNQPKTHLSVIDISPDHPARTLVFLHGYGGQARQWIYQLQTFSLQNRVIAIDLRGHGQSDRPNSRYTMEELLSDLIGALDNLGVAGRFVLLGHSFGGALATEFAARYPERLERLVLIATAGEFRLNWLYRSLLSLPVTFLRSIGRYTRNWLGAPPHVMHALYHNNLSRWNGWSLLRDLQLPTLVIRGYQDSVFEKAHFEDVVRIVTGAIDVNIKYSGHMVMIERRDAVNRAIREFLEETPRSWRQTATAPIDDGQATLVQDRPWLKYYESGVPNTVAVPRVPLQTLLHSTARRFPNRVALDFEGLRIRYRRLVDDTNRFANALLALGLQKGERVIFLLPNIPTLVTAFFGTLTAGGVVVFTLPITEEEELVRQIQETKARFLVTLTTFQELAARVKARTELHQTIMMQATDCLPYYKVVAMRASTRKGNIPIPDLESGPGIVAYRDLLRSMPKMPPDLDVTPADLAVIHYTGGTTALPKGVMLSHNNLVANTLQVRHWMPAAEEGDEIFLSVLSFAHSYGLTTALTVPIALGATIILKLKFEVNDVLQAIKRHKPTIFPGVPSMYVAINNAQSVRKAGIRSIKACISGSAPLPVEVQEAFERLTRGRLVEGYGLTEASPVTHANPLHGLRKVGSIGIPLPSTEARIIDLAKGEKIMPAGQIGELAVRGPQVMMGYWQNKEASQQTITKDGWLLTGDVAQMDSDGYFRIIARKADMWYPERPDEPAFPRDVEEVLYEIPQVNEAAVVAIAGQPIAFVVRGREEVDHESIIAYCRRRLPPALVPRLVIFVDDFPRSFIGKVLRRELARHFNETHPAD
jgi:long-chain acyl-CoA synthetase